MKITVILLLINIQIGSRRPSGEAQCGKSKTDGSCSFQLCLGTPLSNFKSFKATRKSHATYWGWWFWETIFVKVSQPSSL